MNPGEPTSSDGGVRGPKKTFLRHVWVVGLALYVLVVWLVGWQRLRDALMGLDLRFLAGVALIEVAGEWIRALKWRFALGPGSQAIGLFFLSRCGGYWMPMRMGEFSPLLFREHRTPRMGAWIVIDRVLEISVTLALGAVGVMVLRMPVRHLGAAIAAMVAVLVVAPLYILTRREMFLWVAGRTREGSPANRVSMFLAGMRDGVIGLRRRIPLAAIVTLVAGCLDVAGSMALYMSFGYPRPFALFATAKCVHALTCAIPVTPNATGVPFLTSGMMLNQVGGIPVAVVATAVAVAVALINVVFWTSAGLAATDLRKRPR